MPEIRQLRMYFQKKSLAIVNGKIEQTRMVPCTFDRSLEPSDNVRLMQDMMFYLPEPLQLKAQVPKKILALGDLKVRGIVQDIDLLMKGSTKKVRSKLKELEQCDIEPFDLEYATSELIKILEDAKGSAVINMKQVIRNAESDEASYYEGPLLGYEDNAWQFLPCLLRLHDKALSQKYNEVQDWHYLLLTLLFTEPDLAYYRRIFFYSKSG